MFGPGAWAAFAAGMLSAAMGLCLGGCNATPAQKQALTTLASVAAADNVQVKTLVLGGALFCQKIAAATQPAIALANVAGAPVSVVGQTSSDVATACRKIEAVPVSPPADPSAAPVVSAAVALSAV